MGNLVTHSVKRTNSSCRHQKITIILNNTLIIFNYSDFRQPVIFWFFFIKEKEQEDCILSGAVYPAEHRKDV